MALHPRSHRATISSPLRLAILLLAPALLGLGACAPAPEEAPDPEPAAGHLHVRALYAPDGQAADDARFIVETPEGERVTGPTSRTGFDLDAGRYVVTATLGEAEATADAEVRGGERTDLDVILDAGVLEVGAVAVEGGSPMPEPRYQILSQERDIRGERRSIAGPTSRTTFVLPAGAYVVRAEEDQAGAERSIEVRAGERTEAVVALDAGVLEVRAVEPDGSAAPPELRWQILAAEEDLRGRRETVVGTTRRDQFVLPAGEYLLQARVGDRVAQEKIEVEAGARLEVEVALPPVAAGDAG